MPSCRSSSAIACQNAEFTVAISGRLYMGRLATDALMVFPLTLTSYPFDLGGYSGKILTRSPETRPGSIEG
jgi:hypothetical protein